MSDPYMPRASTATKKPKRFGKVALIAVIVFALIVLAIVGVLLWLNSSLGNLRRIPMDLPEDRPALGLGTNIMLMGVDAGTARNGDSSSILDDATAKKWPAGKNRSDATMIVHISDDFQSVYVVAFPRDSYVPIYDNTGEQHGSQKINAALSLYGPAGATATLETLTGIRIDHVAMVDWDGFTTITDELGGVTMRMADGKNKKFDGDEALTYVRERYHLPNGDFDRIRRQQNFMRAVAQGVVDRGMVYNPIELKRMLDVVTTSMAVDEQWSGSDIRKLAISMRNVGLGSVHFMTIPVWGTDNDPVAGSIVVINTGAAEGLYDAIRTDTVGSWVQQNPNLQLGRDVS